MPQANGNSTAKTCWSCAYLRLVAIIAPEKILPGTKRRLVPSIPLAHSSALRPPDATLQANLRAQTSLPTNVYNPPCGLAPPGGDAAAEGLESLASVVKLSSS